MRIVLFSGGSACRTINIALCRRGCHVTRLVPAWDSGGSSKPIRDRLGIMSVGDLRRALTTMAIGEGRKSALVTLLEARVPPGLSRSGAWRTFQSYLRQSLVLFKQISPSDGQEIANCLQHFASAAGADFDYRNGSIGNFVLAGACVASDDKINDAVSSVRKMLNVEGDVWPSSDDDDLSLNATLKNGKRVLSEHAITSLSDNDSDVGIQKYG
ncbi:MULTISPECIES: 2-phospho-L-lactate transferase CofD family protein [Rhizobium/Agrobacterium group]|uniref:Uncharacterized protein n=2 Tax=Rhizobium/Agrobacterium group TaxID=227290 RepID=B9K3L2_ALLAM|nr:MULTISPECIES: 2-phospho-L-lactate transferase CofD family protein [Rhizobium/Agrobacterium group]ACM39460.1 conserved hypothetical protein [Allorhizobium ampelinum S4]MCF1449020.1 hypothetical protein [Allorhizobium ampelinum]MUO31259.1 hypothetical protein [Agrobacterium vitis]MUO44912.1 hypothetical protein [Agrobacterium vitis]MUP12965.1 hypothetical protein [Agrobacterium vitis]